MKVKQFELTPKCNLNCSYCYHQNERKNWKQEIPYQEVMNNVGKGDLVYLGGGEPMLYPNIIQLTHDLSSIASKVVLSTNGIIFKEVDKTTQLQISIPAITPEIYEQITRKDKSFLEETKRNLLKYKKIYELLINTTVCEENFEDIKNISNFCEESGLILRLRPMFGASKDLQDKTKTQKVELKLNRRKVIYSFGEIEEIEYFTPEGKQKHPS